MARVDIPDEKAEEPTAFVYGHYAPKITAASSHYSFTVYQETKLPFRVVEAARIRTAQINGCRTCQTWRSSRDLPAVFAREQGELSRSFVGRAESVPDDAFYNGIAEWRTSSLFSESERVAIEYAERMGEAPHSFAGDEVFWRRVHAQFTDEEIVDLTFSIGSWIAAGRALHILEIDPEVCVLAPSRAA